MKVLSGSAAATFGWLCVETAVGMDFLDELMEQPPSGGCVLKHQEPHKSLSSQKAATFGWLCVETPSPF